MGVLEGTWVARCGHGVVVDEFAVEGVVECGPFGRGGPAGERGDLLIVWLVE